jgi:hypothetical protein
MVEIEIALKLCAFITVANPDSEPTLLSKKVIMINKLRVNITSIL